MFESTKRVHTTTKNFKKKAKDNRCMLECQRCEYGDGDKENEYTLPLLNKNFYFSYILIRPCLLITEAYSL